MVENYKNMNPYKLKSELKNFMNKNKDKNDIILKNSLLKFTINDYFEAVIFYLKEEDFIEERSDAFLVKGD